MGNVSAECEESLFRNFNILSLPPEATSRLSSPSTAAKTPSVAEYIPFSSSVSSNPNSTLMISPGILDLTFTSTNDDDGYPFLHFQNQVETEMRHDEGERLHMCAVGWAKRRGFDNEVPTGRDTSLSAAERERLMQRRDVDMVGLERDGACGEEMDGLEEGEVRE